MKEATARKQQRLRQLRDATAQALPAAGALQMGGQTVQVSDLLGVLDDALETFATAEAAKAAARQALATRTQKIATAEQLAATFKAYLIGTWGKGSPRLEAFGFATKVPTPLTGEQLALRAAKARLTRKARGTRSAKQRQAITVEGQPGLVLLAADGTPLAGILKGPSPPGIGPPD